MNTKSTFKVIKNWLIFLLIIAGLWAGWRGTFDHFNLLPYCNISIRKDILRGDTKSIKQALSNIRQENKSVYAEVCRYIKHIEEKRCYNADGHIDRPTFERIHEGCYIRGSRTIYLFPLQFSDDTVKKRAETIKALSRKSKDFWISK